MGGISELAMEIEELFFVENKTVFEIATAINWPVDEVRAYLESIDETEQEFPELSDDDTDDLAAYYGHTETFSEFD
jgi:hypothetical protein